MNIVIGGSYHKFLNEINALHRRLEENGQHVIAPIKDARQSKLDSRRREENIKNAYSLSTNTTSKKTLENKKIILIDDVFTTGSTVEECAKTLKKVNPKKVDVLTIAKD